MGRIKKIKNPKVPFHTEYGVNGKNYKYEIRGGNMSRKAKPIELAVLNGHRTKEEIRIRKENELKPLSDNKECPDWLDDVGRKEWHRLYKELDYLNLLTNIDTHHLAVYCDAYSNYVAAVLDINERGTLIHRTMHNGHIEERVNPSVNVSLKYAEMIRKFCVEFGMTPSARAKMAIPRELKKDDKSEKLKGLL